MVSMVFVSKQPAQQAMWPVATTNDNGPTVADDDSDTTLGGDDDHASCSSSVDLLKPPPDQQLVVLSPSPFSVGAVMSPSTQTLNVLSQHDANGGGDLRYDFSQLDHDASETTCEQMSTKNRKLDTASPTSVTTNQNQDTAPPPSLTTDLPIARTNYQQVINTSDRCVIKTNPEGAKKTVATKRKEDTTSTNPEVDTATRPSVTTDVYTKDLPVVKTNAKRIKKGEPAVKKQQVAKLENHNVERADHQSTDRSISMANRYGTNSQTNEPDVKKQGKDPPLSTTNQHVTNHRQRMDTTMRDLPVVTVNIKDTTMDEQGVAASQHDDRKSRQVIVDNPSLNLKNWVTLSFSLPDPGTLGIVIKKLHLANLTYCLVKEVKAGSQAETAGVMVGDVVVAKYEEVLKWGEAPRPISFSVYRNCLFYRNCLSDVAQEQAKDVLHHNAERGTDPQKDARQAVAAALTEHGMHGKAADHHIKFFDKDGTRIKAESLASHHAEVNGNEQKSPDRHRQGAKTSIVDKVPKAPSTAKPVASPSAGEGSFQGKMEVSSLRKDKTRPKFPPQSLTRGIFSLDDVTLDPSKNEDDAMESEAQATGVRTRKLDRTSLAKESRFASKGVDVAKRRNGNQIAPQRSSPKDMAAVPCCKACQKKTSGSTSNRSHHALCPKNPQFTNSGAREKLEFIRCGIELGCKACKFHYQYGRPAPQNEAHAEACRRRKERQKEELQRVESETKVKDPSNCDSSVMDIEVEATVAEPASIASKKKAASTSRTKKRKSAVLREKSNMIDKITKPEKETSRKIHAQEAESQPDAIAVPKDGREQNDRSSKKCRYEFESDTDSEEDINLKQQTKRSVRANQNTSSSIAAVAQGANSTSRGATLPLVVKTCRRKASLVTPSAASNLSLTTQRRKTKPAQDTASAGKATNIEATAGYSRPNWISCTNPWGPSGFVEGDVVLTSPSGGFSHHETMYGGERFVVSPFHSQSDYITTHRTPSEGFEVLQLTRDPMAQLPWGFTYRRHEFGGACLVTSVDPLSSAASAVYRGNESEQTPGLGLRLHDMLLSVNGKSIGGMTELGAGIELDVCGQHLELVVSRFKNPVGATRQLVKNAWHERKSFHDAINDRSRLDWYEVNPHSEQASDVDMQQAIDMTPLDPFDSQGSLRDSFDFRAIAGDSRHDRSAQGSIVTPAAFEQVSMSPNRTQGLEQFSLSQISLASPNSLASYQDAGGSVKAKAEEIDRDHINTENCTGDDNDDNCCLGCICGEIHPEPVRVFWIQCDDCQSWYNVASKCAGFTELEVSSAGRWLCRACDDTVDDQSSVVSNSERWIALLKEPSTSETLECFTSQEHDPPSRRDNPGGSRKPNDKHMRYIPRSSFESTSSTNNDENEQLSRSESISGSKRKTFRAQVSEKLLSGSRVDREVRRTDDEDVLLGSKPDKTVKVPPNDTNGSFQEMPISISVGTLVSVAKRDWAGNNKEGGVGTTVDSSAADDGTDTISHVSEKLISGSRVDREVRRTDNEDVFLCSKPDKTVNVPPNDTNGRFQEKPTLLSVGTLVSVAKRDWAGSNKEGGVGTIVDFSAADDGTDTMFYDVNYSLGGREKGIGWQYVTAYQFPERRNARRVQRCEELVVVPESEGHAQGHGGSRNSGWKEPKKTEKGFFQRPVGNLRKGMDWDSTRGTCVSLSNPDLAGNSCLEEEAKGTSNEPAIDQTSEKEESVQKEANQALVSFPVPGIAPTDVATTYQGTKRNLTAGRQMTPPPRRSPAKEKRREEKSVFIQSLEELLNKFERTHLNVGNCRAQRANVGFTTMTEKMLRLAIRVWNVIPGECGSIQEASAYLEEVDASEYRIEKFLTGDPGKVLYSTQHGETEVALLEWMTNKEATKARVGVQVDQEMANSQRSADLKKVVVGSHVAVYWPDDDEYYDATVLRVCQKGTKLTHFLKYDDGECDWVDLCEHKFRVHRRTGNGIHDIDSVTGASTYDSLLLDIEAKGEECITECGIEEEANPHEKTKILSWGRVDREGRRTADGDILPRLMPKKNADGTFTSPREKPPLGFFCDPNRGVYTPKPTKVKDASVAMHVQCNELGAVTTLHDQPKLLASSSSRLEIEAKGEECLTECVIEEEANPHEKTKILSRGRVDHEGRRTADGDILPRLMPKKNADGTYTSPRGKPPRGFVWDPNRGLFTPESTKVKEASVAIHVQCNALRAVTTPHDRPKRLVSSSSRLEIEAKGEECITECGIEEEANPHEKTKILSWGRVDREGRRTADGEILPRLMPKKNADGTYTSPRGKPPLGFFWDLNRGLFSPGSTKVKEASVAMHIQCNALGAVTTPHDQPKLLASSSSRSASKASKKKNCNVTDPWKFDREGRRAEGGCILPELQPKKAANGIYAEPKHKSPHGFVWDPSQGIYVLETREEKEASIALPIEYDAPRAPNKPKGKSTTEGLEKSAPRVLHDVSETVNGVPAAQRLSVDREGRETQDGYILPESKPERAANGTYARPLGKSPLCMKWDYCRGVWVPKYKRKSKTETESSEESEPGVLDEVCKTADASPEDTKDE